MAASSVTSEINPVTFNVDPSHREQFMSKIGLHPTLDSFLPMLFSESYFTTVKDLDSEALSLKLKEVKPLILYFDLDSTLFSVRLKPEDKDDFSASMEGAGAALGYGVSDSDGEIEFLDSFESENPNEGVVRLYRAREGSNFKNVKLISTEYSLTAESVRFIGRVRYMQLFMKIDRINQAASEKLQRPLIVINILTNAAYDEDDVKALLASAFPNCKTIREGIYQNRYRDIDRSTGDYTTKGTQIEHNHRHLFGKLGVEMLDTCLLDDALVNIADVEKHGFRALHIPSNPHHRNKEQSYVFGGGDHYFSTLEDTVDFVAAKHGIKTPEIMYFHMSLPHTVRLTNASFPHVEQSPVLTATRDITQVPNYLDELFPLEDDLTDSSSDDELFPFDVEHNQCIQEIEKLVEEPAGLADELLAVES